MALPTPTRRAPIILLVDDNDALRDLLQLALHGRGYQVEACADSRKAVAMAQQLPSRPDLLISDIELGALSGPAMAGQLRDAFPEMKILFVSGYPGAVSGSHSVPALSGASFMSKPFSLQQLFERVTEILAE
jgi:two-component system cell cycle sensor histidine kinase/response regulator CckA